MKSISLGLLMSALLVGCSTTKNYDFVAISQPGVDQETFKEMAKPFTYAPVRTPSSEIVSRPTYYWEADSLKIPVTAGAKINNVYNVKFNQYATYEVKEKVQRTVTEVQTQWEQGQNNVLVCAEQEGTGKSALWNNFYSAPRPQKAAALAKAIDGIGDVSAESLVKKNYFANKPRNWDDFEAEIHRAAQNGVITKSVEYQVLYKYRTENYTKLGYNTQLSGVCRLEVHTYYYPRDVLVNKLVWVDEIRTQRDLISTDVKPYHFVISGQKLQSFETEMLVFSFNHETNLITLSPSSYTNYSISTEANKIMVTGISRKNVDLPSDVLPTGATLEASGGVARFSAPVNKLYLPATATDGHLLMSIRVSSCKKGTFSACAVFKKDVQSAPAVIQEVKSGLAQYQFNTTPGRTYWVSYWINAANSPWYVNNVITGPSEPEL